MYFPMRRTPAIRLCSSVATIPPAGDFNGSGFSPSHTDSTTSPVIRLASPCAMVSTSGSSGIQNTSLPVTKIDLPFSGGSRPSHDQAALSDLPRRADERDLRSQAGVPGHEQRTGSRDEPRQGLP